MKKAFTLVELLVIIAILGMIAIIAIPQAMSFVESTRTAAYRNLENQMKRSAQNYFVVNPDLLPTTLNTSRSVSLQELVDSRAINKIVDSKTGEFCDGYISVIKVSDNKYEYKPYLSCSSSYITGNYMNNQNVVSILYHLYYDFNDYQEPTINLIPNSPVNSFPTIGNSHGTYNTNQYNNNVYFSIGTIQSVSNNIVTLSSVGRTINTYDVLTPQTTGGGVTAGTRYFIKKISPTSFSLHAYDNSQDGSKGFQVHSSIINDQRISINATNFPTMWLGPPHLPNSAIVKEIVNDCFSTLSETKHECIRLTTSHKPEGDVDGMAYSVLPPVVSGLTYTASFYYRAANPASVGRTIRFSAHTSPTSWASGSTQTLSSDWRRYTVTAIAPSTGGTNLYFWPSKLADVEISEIQFEQKPYDSRFAISSRTGTVADLSNSNNNAPLGQTTTPRWIDTGRVSGAYLFNGTSTYIETSDNVATDNKTYAMFIRPTNLTSNGVVFSNHNTALNTNLSLRVINNKAVLHIYNSSGTLVTHTSNANLTTSWNHVAIAQDSNEVRLYINGVLDSRLTITMARSSEKIIIGARKNGATYENFFNGSVDEFIILKGAQQENAINQLYNKLLKRLEYSNSF